MKPLIRLFGSAILGCVSIFCFCSKSRIADGGASETTNGITARIVYSDSSACGGATVRIRRQDYVAMPPKNAEKTAVRRLDSLTDNNGYFHITTLDTGSYFIEVNDNRGNVSALPVVVKNENDTIPLGACTIRKSGVLRGIVPGTSKTLLFAQIKGLERIALVDSGSFIFNDLPTGKFALSFATDSLASVSSLIDSFEIISGDTTVLSDIAVFTYSKMFTLNTTPAGADVGEAVLDFPLLIRLTAPDFDFTTASASGSDIVFVRGNRRLAYAIDQWDVQKQQAQIWVRLDTILGNSNSQVLRMLWGNSAVPGENSSEKVFDTATGFQGVWHFEEAGDAPCIDATINNHSGTCYGMATANSQQGIIGKCRIYDGISSYFQMHGSASSTLNFPQNGNYSVSAWVRIDSLDTTNHVVMSKGNEQYFLKVKYDSLLKTPFWQFAQYNSSQIWEFSQAPASNGDWHYVVGVRSNDKQYLYVDGTLADSGVTVMNGVLPREVGNDVTVGRYIQSITASANEGFCYFRGAIDELCISSIARSKAWIKLCYMNQKQNNVLIK